MDNISNDERNMIGLLVEGGGAEEEEKDEEEEEDINIETNIPSKTEPEPVEIVEEPMSEQEATIIGYLPAPRDEQDKEIETLRNEN